MDSLWGRDRGLTVGVEGDALERMKLCEVCPVLQVSDLNRAVTFYCEVLGFERDFVYGDPPYYAGVKRGAGRFHLNACTENALRRGMGAVYAFCDEVDTYYGEVTARGAEVTSPLATFPYGMRDFQVKDCDGNLITFGCAGA